MKIHSTPLLIILLMLILCSCSSKPKIIGCVDQMAINYNPLATVMQDSTCIYLEVQPVTINLGKKRIVIDTLKFKQFEYDFIYTPINNDTIKSLKRHRYGRRYYHYHYHTIYRPDTLTISSYSDSRYVFIYDKIKAIEKIDGYNPREFSVKVKKEGSTLLNPRNYYKYQIETAEYSTFASFNTTENYKNYLKGTLINTKKNINYWYQDHPYSITVDSRYDYGTFYRTNIVRY